MVGAPLSRQTTLSRIVALPENGSALHAVQELASFFQSGRSQPPFNPLVLHGAPGTGKSCLAAALARDVIAEGKRVVHVSCRDLKLQPNLPGRTTQQESPAFLKELGDEAIECDLFVLEDLQTLPVPAVERLVQLIDQRRASGGATVFTSLAGPRHLANRGGKVSSRLASRLAQGLVVELETLQPASRKMLLLELAQRRQLVLGSDAANWLAARLPGSARQLEGAIRQLETLSRLNRKLDERLMAEHFGPQIDALKPSVDRIVEQVGGYFQVEPEALQSKRRYRNVMLPRQVGMYLARQLTSLSLEQIGAYFGGRDHSTVLHACRKVEQAMKNDAELSGMVKHLHAELA